MAFGCLGYTGVDKPVFLICLILHLKASVHNDSNDNLVSRSQTQRRLGLATRD